MSECTIGNEFLCKHSLFGGLSEPELVLIRAYLDERAYPEGEVILSQGQPNNSVYFIADGEVSVIHHSESDPAQSKVITVLKKGDSFGEMELIDIQNCAASVITTKPTRVITLSNRDMYVISKTNLKVYTMLILNLARDISRRLRAADEMLTLISSKY